jgi:ribonuclease Z
MPHLLESWPVEGDLVVPLEAMPEKLRDSMRAAWRQKQKNQEIIEGQSEQ